MSIVVGTNSFVTIAEADTYLTSKLGATDWFELSDNPIKPGADSKESFLVEAFYRLLYNVNYSLSLSSSSTVVKNAQMEFAFFLVSNYCDFSKREAMTASGITEFTYSKWKEKLAGVSIPVIVDNILQKGGYSSGNFLQEITVE